MKVNCLTCDKEFDKSESQIKKSPNHFCSRSCAAKTNNKKQIKRLPEGHCKKCNAQIQTSKVFCSQKCKTIYGELKAVPEEVKKQMNVQAVVKWRQRMKIKAVVYKGGCCSRCGYNKSMRALQFHHIDPSQKDFAISKVTRSWENIKDELDKCVLLCANCHLEVHDLLLL